MDIRSDRNKSGATKALLSTVIEGEEKLVGCEISESQLEELTMKSRLIKIL